MMEINQVVVNKLPSSCSECGWTKSLLTSNLQCAFNMMNIDCDPFEARSSWCPLVVDEVCEWIPVSERLPKTMQKVEVIFNDRGRYRVTIATYIKARTVLACDFMDDETPPEALDYDETIDDYWAVEGFWEDMWTSDGSYCIEEEIIYWRPLPLPQPPKEGE